MEEDQNFNAPHFVQQHLSVSPELQWTSNPMVHTDTVETALPRNNAMEERALFLTYHTDISPFPKYPTLQNFPIVVQSDLIPGLKGNCSDFKLLLFIVFGFYLFSVVIIFEI